ncbi:beta-lactamase regulator AmpE [Alteromonas sp. a30]|uniref:beta-lactamase regulator AmpE n=1 Tax=Alteromonas sp. a30 TaxID=2730917 RepID=UPI00227FD7C2|nr:beta-lactamase regulator AmpE [Alteromonas sp. a30]MCY7294228.1 beta-lactamase regulator AmpE [Alteromonas sp. a30]
MALFSLLLVFALERMLTKTRLWRNETYLSPYYSAISRLLKFEQRHSVLMMYVIVFIPAVLVFVVQTQVENVLFQLFLGTAILMIGTGCPNVRTAFKGYLQAANRGDMEACDLYAQELSYKPDSGRSFGQHIAWINYTHYMAVALWFIALGPAGVMLYISARYMAVRLVQVNHSLTAQIFTVLHVLDWIPVRLTTLGYMLVGNFTDAFGIWGRALVDPKISAADLIAKIAKASEVVEVGAQDCTEEPCTMLKLAKRNVMLMLVVVALLTLSGWLI